MIDAAKRSVAPRDLFKVRQKSGNAGKSTRRQYEADDRGQSKFDAATVMLQTQIAEGTLDIWEPTEFEPGSYEKQALIALRLEERPEGGHVPGDCNEFCRNVSQGFLSDLTDGEDDEDGDEDFEE